METTRSVMVDLADHERLVENNILLNVIMDTLFMTASLSWNKKELTFGCAEVGNLVRVISPSRYDTVLAILKAKEDDHE